MDTILTYCRTPNGAISQVLLRDCSSDYFMYYLILSQVSSFCLTCKLQNLSLTLLADHFNEDSVYGSNATSTITARMSADHSVGHDWVVAARGRAKSTEDTARSKLPTMLVSHSIALVLQLDSWSALPLRATLNSAG